MTNTSPIFEISQLKVNYGFRCAVDDLSLSQKPGVSLGLLGLNGAGKTSTIRTLLGMVRPRAGQVKVLGQKPGSVKVFKHIGFAPEEGTPPEYLSGEEYLGFVAELRISDREERKRQVMELMEGFELPAKKRISEYSKGLRRKVILAQAFMGKPDFLILDEPLNGLDPIFILRLRQRIESYVAAGGTALISSHILAEIEKTCHEVAILHLGKLVCLSSVDALMKEFGSIETAFAKKIGKA